jgi:hypothetical protein
MVPGSVGRTLKQMFALMPLPLGVHVKTVFGKPPVAVPKIQSPTQTSWSLIEPKKSTLGPTLILLGGGKNKI